MRIDRMLAITVMLLHRRKVTARELADKFEVSVRTIYRDVEAINMAGIPVVSYQGGNGGIGIMDNYKIDKRLLTLEDITSILTALKGINATFENGEVNNAFDKINSLVPLDKTAMVQQNLEQIVVDLIPWGFNSRHKEALKQVQAAISTSNLIRFIYENTRYEVLERTIEPMTLIFKGYTWYLFGYCCAKEDYRLFRISRMKELRVLDGQFTRKQMSYSEYSMKDEDRSKWIPITLKFSPDIRMRVEEYFGDHIKEINKTGEIIVRISFPNDEWLYSTILGFGEKVEVIEPASVREIVLEKVKKISAKYEHDIMVSH